MELQDLYFRNTWLEIDLDAIAHNVSEMKKRLMNSEKIIAVIKANAYGHGDVQVAKAALESGADYLAVAFLDEAISIRRKGIDAPTIIYGALSPNYVEIAAEQNLTVTVYSKKWILEASRILREKNLRIKIHIKIDSGMGRLGVRSSEEFHEILNLIDSEIFELEGVYTHFSTADELDETYVHEQVEIFKKIIDSMPCKPPMIHCSNSAAALRFENIRFTAVRFGIGMYGLTPAVGIKNLLPYELKPALSFHTRLSQIKKVTAGSRISYGARYQSKEDEWIGTLPVGYADGWLRKLTGQEVLVNGKRVPIVGTICMDQCMIRLPFEIENGTQVTLIGKNGNNNISVEEVAERLDTINYEVVCGISVRVPRIFKRNGKIIEIKNGLF
ncbi:MAG: alanine racemase [Bacillales bacterium]|jgi:alanine racemase|nr:alanine racemase [Bacillales bacterium]